MRLQSCGLLCVCKGYRAGDGKGTWSTIPGNWIVATLGIHTSQGASWVRRGVRGWPEKAHSKVKTLAFVLQLLRYVTFGNLGRDNHDPCHCPYVRSWGSLKSLRVAAVTKAGVNWFWPISLCKYDDSPCWRLLRLQVGQPIPPWSNALRPAVVLGHGCDQEYDEEPLVVRMLLVVRPGAPSSVRSLIKRRPANSSLLRPLTTNKWSVFILVPSMWKKTLTPWHGKPWCHGINIQKLLVTSASLLVTSALLVATRS